MLPPPDGPNEDKILCPNCGSEEIKQTGENYFRIVPGNSEMHEYVCEVCKTKFFPAMEESDKSKNGKLIEQWSRKVDHDAWQERMRDKKYSQKVYYIRVEK